jgi:3-phenylpropionate/trans-cinnamate dioxygenase ferredoxin subunit
MKKEFFSMEDQQSLQDKIERGSQDAGIYFRRMAQFVGFDKKQADAIFESRFIIEKYIPEIVAQFYDHLLRYPRTRRFFQKPDGSLNYEYVQFRMTHLSNFWRRTASGPYDDEYARYIDYVGLAHTRRGADPNIDIAERYVIGQVGFVQHAISESLSKELHEIDAEWEVRALKAWNLLMMVILEMLARVYHEDEQTEFEAAAEPLDSQKVKDMAIDSYERGLGMHRLLEERQVFYIGKENEIPLGERKLVHIMGLSIGVFHHGSGWYAIKNKCLHAGGPVAEGRLRGNVLTCPWHGYQYDLSTGALLEDPIAKLEMYPVEMHEGQIFVKLPIIRDIPAANPDQPTPQAAQTISEQMLAVNEFRLSELKPGQVGAVEVAGESVAVFNLEGNYYALEDYCPHAGGPLSEGRLEGQTIICPWHGSCFDVTTGAVTCGPAKIGVRAYSVIVEGKIGKVVLSE